MSIKITASHGPYVYLCSVFNLFSSTTLSHLNSNLKLRKPGLFFICVNERFLGSLVELANCNPSIHRLQQLFFVC